MLFDKIFRKTQVITETEKETICKTQEKNSVNNAKKKIQDEAIQSLEVRVKKATMSNNGLYPHEILMLHYAHTYNNKSNTFQNFWKWQYSVLNPQGILDSLYQRGFICLEENVDALFRLTIPQLKEMLEAKEIKVSGKKADLISRIIDSYNNDELECKFTEKHFVLTNMGKEEIKNNEYVIYLHRNNYMSVWEMNYYLYNDNPSHLEYRDIIWRELNVKAGKFFQNGEYGLYRNIKLDMHDFILEEKKYKTAFSLLTEVISFDLSGLGNGNKFTEELQNDIYKKVIYESRLVNLLNNNGEVTLAPGITRCFNDLYKLLEMPTEEFVEYTYEVFSKIDIYERIFNSKECANIVLSEIGLENRKLQNSYLIAQQRLKKYIGL